MKKQLLLIILIICPGIKIFAQTKLKSIQATNIWAPANVKIDGKIDEWESNFQAYNKTTRLFYTMANNDKYVYLAIYSTDAQNNTKIAAGGITVTINTNGKKNTKDAFTLTFPVITKGSRRGMGRMARGQSGADDTAATNAAHRQLVAGAKEIKVLGFKDVDDTLISIYNDYGIKTAIGYDTLGNYAYEIAIPLKEISITSLKPIDIAYNIKVNGLEMGGGGLKNINISGDGGGFAISGLGDGGGGRSGRGGGGRGAGRANEIDIEDLTSPTDFWGKYTLAINK